MDRVWLKRSRGPGRVKLLKQRSLPQTLLAGLVVIMGGTLAVAGIHHRMMVVVAVCRVVIMMHALALHLAVIHAMVHRPVTIVRHRLPGTLLSLGRAMIHHGVVLSRLMRSRIAMNVMATCRCARIWFRRRFGRSGRYGSDRQRDRGKQIIFHEKCPENWKLKKRESNFQAMRGGGGSAPGESAVGMIVGLIKIIMATAGAGINAIGGSTIATPCATRHKARHFAP